MSWIAGLPSPALFGLARLLRRSGNSSFVSSASLQTQVPDTLAASATSSINQLLGEGWSADQLATLLEAVAQDRGARLTVDEGVELVTTGPEVGDVYNRDTLAVVYQLFQEARESVFVAGYALYEAADIFRPLAERMDANPNLEVTCCFDIQRERNDTTIPDLLVAQFASRFRTDHWPMGSRLPKIYYDPRSISLEPGRRSSLHAKCIVADSARVFISSANFTGAAQNRNIEVGVLIQSARLARQLTEFFVQLIQSGALVRVPMQTAANQESRL